MPSRIPSSPSRSRAGSRSGSRHAPSAQRRWSSSRRPRPPPLRPLNPLKHLRPPRRHQLLHPRRASRQQCTPRRHRQLHLRHPCLRWRLLQLHHLRRHPIRRTPNRGPRPPAYRCCSASSTMNESDSASLASLLSVELRCTDAEAQRILGAVARAISNSLRQDLPASIPGVLTITTSVRPPAARRTNGATTAISRRRVPSVRLSKRLLDAVARPQST